MKSKRMTELEESNEKIYIYSSASSDHKPIVDEEHLFRRKNIL